MGLKRPRGNNVGSSGTALKSADDRIAPVSRFRQRPAGPCHGGAPRREAIREMRLARIRRYIEKNFADPDLNARDCARAVGMSVRALHLVLRETGESFCETVARLRLEHCRQMLCCGRRVESVADVAFACGSNSLASFYRAFRRQFGTCPMAIAGHA